MYIKKLVIACIIFIIVFSCNNGNEKVIEKSYKYQINDTLLFIVRNNIDKKKTKFEQIKYKIIYSYNHQLVKVPTITNDFDKPLYNKIIFDDDLCRKCFIKENHIYYSIDNNQYYCDTTNYEEVILFHTSMYDFDISIEHYQKKHQFNNRIQKLFPNLKYFNSTLRDYKDSIVDYVEFIVPYIENKQVLFTYNNFKNIIYKKDDFVLKVMYVKKGLRRNEIWATAHAFKTNSYYTRIMDSIPIVVK